jgi:hypothetical protein
MVNSELQSPNSEENKVDGVDTTPEDHAGSPFKKETPATPPTPLRTWIIGLSAPLLLVCLCGGIILALAGANYYVNKGQVNLWVPPINLPDGSGPQKIESHGGSVEILDAKSALDKIYNTDDRVYELPKHVVEKYTDAQINAMGNTINYTALLDNSTPVTFGHGWCTHNQVILKNNLNDIEIKLVVDGIDVDQNHTAAWILYRDVGTICQRFDAVVDNWSVGEHTLVTKLTINNPINDGTDDYSPGEWQTVYKVTVKSAVEATRAPKK